MKILWVKVGGLWPANTGGRLRSLKTIEELAKTHQMEIITTHEPGDTPVIPVMANVRVRSLPWSVPKKGTLGFVRALVASWFSALPVDLYRCRAQAVKSVVHERVLFGGFDLVVADFLAAMPNMPHAGLARANVPLVLFAHNVEHHIWRRLAKNERHPIKRALLEMEWRKLRRYEGAACNRVQQVVAVSELDRLALESLGVSSPIRAVATGVDIEFFKPQLQIPKDNSLVFSGSMDWYPNEEAVIHFAENMWPLINAKSPGVRMSVVGRNPSLRLKEVALGAGLHVTGTVDDVRPYIAEGSVYVVPLLSGSGTRLKIFEALAMGKALVSTSVGAEGLPMQAGEHYLRADSPQEFAEATCLLLKDRELRQRLEIAGRALVEKHFSWNVVGQQFDSTIREVSYAS